MAVETSATSYGAIGTSSPNDLSARKYCTTVTKVSVVLGASLLSLPIGVALIMTGRGLAVSNLDSTSSNTCYALGILLLFSGCISLSIMRACSRAEAAGVSSGVGNALRVFFN